MTGNHSEIKFISSWGIAYNDFFTFFSRIVNTPYQVAMAEDVSCRLLCHSASNKMTWTAEESQRVIERIQHEYLVHL